MRNRHHNVSPFEEEGSGGLRGMFISALAAPVFAASLIGSLTGRETKFVVTPKGASQTADGLGTFVRHIRWGLLFVAALCASFVFGQHQSTLRLWSLSLLCICVVPIGIWIVARLMARRGPRGPAVTRRRREESSYVIEAEAA